MIVPRSVDRYPCVRAGKARWLALAALVLLAACKPAKSVDYYREHGIERDQMVNRCLAANDNSWDCVNAITAEAERWGTQDIDGFTVVISGDDDGTQSQAAPAGGGGAAPQQQSQQPSSPPPAAH